MWIQRIRTTFKKLLSPPSTPMMGFLGNRSGVVPTGVIGFVYVTLQSSGQTVVARNTVVPMIPGLPVLVVRDPSNNYRITGVFDIHPSLPYPEQSQPDTSQMTWPGASTVWVRDAQILDGVPIPIPGTLSVQVYGRWFFLDNLFHAIDHKIIEMTSELPASGAEWVNVEIDSSGDVSFLHGGNADSWEILTPEDIPISDPSKYFLFSVRLYVGQTQIRKVDGPDCDIFDPRFTRIGGAGSGGGTWGSIGGTLSDQSDLQTVLDEKLNVDGHTGYRILYTSPSGQITVSDNLFFNDVDGSIVVGDNGTPSPPILGTADPSGDPSGWILTNIGGTIGVQYKGIRADGTPGSETAVVSGKRLASFRGAGYDGSLDVKDSPTSGELRIVSAEDFDGSSHGTKLELWVTPRGSTTMSLAATLDPDGNFEIAAGKEYRVNGVQHPHAASDIPSGIMDMARFPLSRGQMVNGKLQVTVSSNDLIVAIKTNAGTDPSASDPVYVKIGDTIRSVTAATSITLADGTNWMNLGGSELGTIEQDLFAYLVWDSNSSVVAITHSRIPYGNVVSDFSATTTNEKYLAGYSGFTTTDQLEVIGRFAATLSLSGTGHLWTVPTFTASNLIQKTIYTTRKLAWTPTVTAQLGTPASVTKLCYYKIAYDEITYNPDITVNDKGSAENHMILSAPMNSAVVSGGSGREIASTGKGLSTNIYAPNASIYINFYDGTTVWVNGYEVNATIRGFLT